MDLLEFGRSKFTLTLYAVWMPPASSPGTINDAASQHLQRKLGLCYPQHNLGARIFYIKISVRIDACCFAPVEKPHAHFRIAFIERSF